MKRTSLHCITGVLFLYSAAVATFAEPPATAPATDLPDAGTLARFAAGEAQKIQSAEQRTLALISIIRTVGRTGDLQGVRATEQVLQKAIDTVEQKDRWIFQAQADLATAGAFASAHDHQTYQKLMDKLKGQPMLPVDAVTTYLDARDYDKLIAFQGANQDTLWFSQELSDLSSLDLNKAKELVKRIDEQPEQGVTDNDLWILRFERVRAHALIGDLDGAIARMEVVPGIHDRLDTEDGLIEDLLDVDHEAGARRIYQDILQHLQKPPAPKFDYSLFRLHLRFGDTKAAEKVLEGLCKSIDTDTMPLSIPGITKSQDQAMWCQTAALAAARLGKDDVAKKYRDAAIRFGKLDGHTPDASIDNDVLEKHAEFLASQGNTQEAIDVALQIPQPEGSRVGMSALLQSAVEENNLPTAIAALQREFPNDQSYKIMDIPKVARLIARDHHTHPINALGWVNSFTAPEVRVEAARSLADEILREQRKAMTHPLEILQRP